MNTGEGQLIGGRYLLGPEIGRGGMAIIYTGTDTVLKREVAIKILYPHITSDSTLIRRFMNEARIIAQLQHRSIVSLYDIAQHDSVPFLVLEYVRGYDLRHMQENLVREGKRLSLEAALLIATIVCDAVAYAHASGIVHRDIKPENVLISTSGEIKITDFGLAHILTDTRITMSGTALGSPEFMSPEHINSGTITSASDVFSLGSLIYWLITGVSPFAADNTMSVLNNIAHNRFPPLGSTGAVADDRIREIVATCLSPLPENRYQDAGGLYRDLRSSVLRFSNDPFAGFAAYVHAPEETDRDLLTRHTASRHEDASAHIRAHNFEKALSVISVMLESGDGRDAAVGLMHTLRRRRSGRWIRTAAEIVLLCMAILLMANEEYNEPITPGSIATTPAVRTIPGPGHLAGPPRQGPGEKQKETAVRRPASGESKRGVSRPPVSSAPPAGTPKRTAADLSGPGLEENHRHAPGTGTLQIITYPWAMVFIDDHYVGETPKLKTIVLPPGRHTLHLMNPYLKPYTDTITILPGTTRTKRVDLNGQPPVP